MIKVVAAEEGVAIGGLDFKDAVAEFENGNVEGPAAEVVNDDGFVFTFVETVGKRGGCRFVDNSFDIETGNFTGLFGRLTLRVIKIGGNGNDRFGDFLTEVGLGVGLGLLKDFGGDFLRSVNLVAHLDVGQAIFTLDDFKGNMLGNLLTFSES